MKRRQERKPLAKMGDRVRLGDRVGVVVERRQDRAAVMWDDGETSVAEVSKLVVVMSAVDVMRAAREKLDRLRRG